jgi:hypothetical protein
VGRKIRVGGQRFDGVASATQRRDQAFTRTFVEWSEVGPPSRDGDGVARAAVALGIVEEALERECQSPAESGALCLQPEPQGHLDAVVSVGEKVTLPSRDSFAVATSFDVPLEELCIHLQVPRLEQDSVVVYAQSIADESVQFEQRLTKGVSRFGFFALSP